jgi:hypothetical protein
VRKFKVKEEGCNQILSIINKKDSPFKMNQPIEPSSLPVPKPINPPLVSVQSVPKANVSPIKKLEIPQKVQNFIANRKKNAFSEVLISQQNVDEVRKSIKDEIGKINGKFQISPDSFPVLKDQYKGIQLVAIVAEMVLDGELYGYDSGRMGYVTIFPNADAAADYKRPQGSSTTGLQTRELLLLEDDLPFQV